MNFKLKLLALLLVVMMMFTSCAVSIDTILQNIPFIGGTEEQTTTPTTTTTPVEDPGVDDPGVIEPVKNLIDIETFDRTKYSKSRSELIAMYTLTEEEFEVAMALLDAMVETSKTAETVDPVDAIYEEFEIAFYHLAQQMTISMIIYYYNTADETASERYLDTQEKFYDLQDKYFQSLRTIYLESEHLRDELFEGWTEQEIAEMLEYDPTIVALKKEIEELQVQFDNLDQKSHGFTKESVEIYKQLIVKNNELAALNGYDNYYEYASKNAYGRDYSAEDLQSFRDNIVKYVVSSYKSIYSDFLKWKNLSSSRQDTFLGFVNEDFDTTKKNYLLLYLNSLEGEMGEAMRDMFIGKNCIFSNNSNSHPTAFQTYLYEDEKGICMFGHNGQTANTMVHEIGHYYAATVNKDLNNYDLCETHSQGNEFLFIKFCEGQLNAAIYDCVRAYNLLSTCQTMILATIVDEFEQRVYALDNETIANMTSDDFDAIMTEVCEPYGGIDWVTTNITNPNDYWRLVAISNPVYYISYAISAAAAVEIFALAEIDEAAAYAAYITLVEGVTKEDGFLGALEKAGLDSPFEEEAFQKISVTLMK